MDEKVFLVEYLLKKKRVKLTMPHFLRHGLFSKDDVHETKEIPSLQMHVERRLQRIKGKDISDRPVTLSLAPLMHQI